MKLNKILITAALVLFGQAAMAAPFSYDCTDCPISVGPDPEIFTTTITVAESGTILADMDLFIDMNHTWSSDLIITLEHAGTSVVVADEVGFGGEDYFPTLYADLTAFTGLDIMGDWNLTIEDDAFGDAGLLSNWTISGDLQAAQVAEPGMLVLMGLGLLGMGVARRRA
ncbi:MAG: proprotein convertase P-domain-containing protein [Gammaproteobacteria bacterium]